MGLDFKMEFLIEYKGETHNFVHRPDHTLLNEAQFINRCWFIVKNKNEPNVQAYADLWLSWKYHGSTYSTASMQLLEVYDHNVWHA